MEVGPANFEAQTLASRGLTNQSQINYYFGSRAGLIVEAAEALLTDHIDAVIAAVESHNDPRDCLTAWCDQVIAFNTSNGATAALVAFPDLYFPSPGDARQHYVSRNVLDASERVGAVLMSVMYALARGKKYRRLNRARVAVAALAMPRVTNSVVMIGMAAAGLSQVWEQHQKEPIFGFDPRKAFRRGVDQIAADLSRSPLPVEDDSEFFGEV